MVKTQMFRKLIFPVLTLVWIFVIFSFSIQSGSISSLQSGLITHYILNFLNSIDIQIEIKLLSLIIRKLAHFTEFFILGSLIKQSSLDLKRNDILLFIFIIPLLDEFIQSFIPDRAMSLIDMGIDSLGISLGISLIALFYWLRKRNTP